MRAVAGSDATRLTWCDQLVYMVMVVCFYCLCISVSCMCVLLFYACKLLC
jgi:hypothetical protein